MAIRVFAPSRLGIRVLRPSAPLAPPHLARYPALMVPTRPFGSAHPAVPVIGLGTWNMERDDRAGAVRAIRAGLDLGMTHVDTAELYGRGKVETLVGEAIAGRRHEVFLVSKVLPTNATRRGTLAACEASLRRLGTDYLDCYLLHWWEGAIPLEETFSALQTLVEQGRIRSFGVSNFDVPELEAALRLVGPNKIACNQILYHLRARDIERRVLPWCEQHGIAVVGYSPFGSGRFPGPSSTGGRLLASLGASRGRTARQVALAYLTRRSSLFAIPKSGRVAGVEENAGAGSVTLTAAEIAAIEEAFPLGRDTGALPVI